MGKPIYEMTLLELYMSMQDAITNNSDQRIINLLAKEITCRNYVPFGKTSFEEELIKNGYRIIEKEKDNIK